MIDIEWLRRRLTLATAGVLGVLLVIAALVMLVLARSCCARGGGFIEERMRPTAPARFAS